MQSHKVKHSKLGEILGSCIPYGNYNYADTLLSPLEKERCLWYCEKDATELESLSV